MSVVGSATGRGAGFIYGYPPLRQRSPTRASRPRFEAYLDGIELANGFMSSAADGQRARF
jgi:elongation factor P--beta-lysine ligase